jgi:hypothetical protein
MTSKPCHIYNCGRCKGSSWKLDTAYFSGCKHLAAKYAASGNSILHFMQYAATQYSIYAEIDFCIIYIANKKTPCGAVDSHSKGMN